MKYLIRVFVLFCLCFLPAHATEVSAEHYDSAMFGDWNGKRSSWLAQGYDLQLTYKLDFLYDTAPGKNKIFALDNFDIKLAADFETAADLKGLSGFIHILSNRGDKPGAHSGRLPHGVDNIETPSNGNTTKVFQAWLQQTFLDERLSLLTGLYDFNSEFYATETSAIFTHPTFGIGAEMAGTGRNGPSIFPTSSFALRIKAVPLPGYYLQTVTLDGVPGDPNNPQGTHVQFNEGDGALNVIEAGLPLGTAENAHNNKLAFGMWKYTTRFNDQLDVDANGDAVKRDSYGAYAIIEKVLKYHGNTNDEVISAFFRLGKTEGDTTQFDHAMSTGLVFTGAIPGYEKDQLGIAYAQEHNSEKYRIASGNSVRYEKSFELGYRHHALKGFIVQPFLQYLMNHSEDISQDNTWWLGMRMEANF